MKLKKLAAALLTASIMLSQPVFAEDKLSNGSSDGYDYFAKLMTYASQLYIDEDVTAEEIIGAALKKAVDEDSEFLDKLLKAGFSSLDEYSEYYTPDEFQDYINNINHTFYGIGVVIQKKGDYVELTNCMEDGSAYAAGMKAGDKIVRVDGADAVKKTIDEVQGMITGELDTEVEVTVLRDDKELTFKLKRRPVSSMTVSWAVLKGDIGYIRVINFAEKTDKEFADALAEMDKNGVSKIILDLRSNPGGYLISAVNAAKLIVPEGIIVQTMYRQEEKNEIFYSDLKEPKYKFNVLVDQNTASSAEILSGAMQDSGIGTLIGETTYGKAVIQEMFRLRDGGFKITTGHYLTRDGHEINKKGIEPDEYVINTTQRVDMSKYTPFDYKIKWKVGDDSDSVKAAKERLRGLGYYSGEVNTEFDEALEKAVTDFQAATDLYPYGVLDISTQVRIENEFYKTDEVVDNQFEKAYTMFGGKIEDLE